MKRMLMLILVLAALIISSPIQVIAFTWTDDFSGGINLLWWDTNIDASSTINQSGGQVTMTQGAGADNGWNNYLKSKFSVAGDFSVTLDYALLDWPENNFERVGLSG